jgi:hypothetical protein
MPNVFRMGLKWNGRPYCGLGSMVPGPGLRFRGELTPCWNGANSETTVSLGRNRDLVGYQKDYQIVS